MPTNRNSSSLASSHLAVSPSFSASLALSRDLMGLIMDGHGTKMVVTIAVSGWMMHGPMKENIFYGTVSSDLISSASELDV